MILIFTGAVVPGAGAYEIAAHAALTILRESVSTRARLGVQVCLSCYFSFLLKTRKKIIIMLI